MDENLAQIEQRIAEGDEAALAEIFGVYRPRLKKVVDSRMDKRLQGRIDSSDILQEAYIDLTKKMKAFSKLSGRMSLFVWMRLVTKERLLQVHRKHLNAEKRDARKEIQLAKGASTNASSVFLAEHLLGRFTSASRNAIRKEMHESLLCVLGSMDLIDHEIITMRCFEELSNAEAAEALGLTENGASSRFVRAMTRLKKRLSEIPGFN